MLGNDDAVAHLMLLRLLRVTAIAWHSTHMQASQQVSTVQSHSLISISINILPCMDLNEWIQCIHGLPGLLLETNAQVSRDLFLWVVVHDLGTAHHSSSGSSVAPGQLFLNKGVLCFETDPSRPCQNDQNAEGDITYQKMIKIGWLWHGTCRRFWKGTARKGQAPHPAGNTLFWSHSKWTNQNMWKPMRLS